MFSVKNVDWLYFCKENKRLGWVSVLRRCLPCPQRVTVLLVIGHSLRFVVIVLYFNWNYFEVVVVVNSHARLSEILNELLRLVVALELFYVVLYLL